MQMAKWKDWPPQKRPEVFPCFYNFIDADGNRILAGLKPLEDEPSEEKKAEFSTNEPAQSCKKRVCYAFICSTLVTWPFCATRDQPWIALQLMTSGLLGSKAAVAPMT